MGLVKIGWRSVRRVLSIFHDETLVADVAVEGPDIMSAASATGKARGQGLVATGTDERRVGRGDCLVNLRGLFR